MWDFNLIIGWVLILAAALSLLQAFRRLQRRSHPPVRTGVEAILTTMFFGVVITIWNTVIPVWVWWILVAAASLLAGMTVLTVARR
ncbi:hypothetical protein HMPREF0290_0821 [Corynebacterium efficiens YS-314]|uniref:Uncharacterized protein n=1 Tax=Corynebacterium efficiens (strain DSM 44549 / YS-314 / AJ 12310 / JCM 11189 / NBRC 100395) TaxID=196164 RepID=Q8FPN9_COREF|nr:hypothetical protein [Corynebacterium efficiens]EEW50560.1 hypothetical protein HMPREF0290_0821 [Corynebacterium efficiens YS-314]BAC18262.1 hypothetical protein [Corynebacterium efficiens YS-314]